jgi:hypothetical protein
VVSSVPTAPTQKDGHTACTRNNRTTSIVYIVASTTIDRSCDILVSSELKKMKRYSIFESANIPVSSEPGVSLLYTTLEYPFLFLKGY